MRLRATRLTSISSSGSSGGISSITGGVNPSLDLRFADNKSLVDAVSGQNLITFTRASSATFIDSTGTLQTAATDVPRFDHNPTTGESLGLLIEEARTNLRTYSEQFDNAAWSKVRSSVTANAATAPNGTQTADKFIASTDASTTHFIRQDISATSGVTYTQTLYAKAEEYSQILLGFDADNSTFATGNVVFTLTGAGSAGTPSGGITSSSIQALPNGWFRCHVTATAAATGTGVIRTNLVSGGSGSFTGDGTSGLFLWGAQLEAGAFPTSYIPTTTAAATRAADVATITGSNFSSWYRQDEGTLYVDGSTATFGGATGFVAINGGGNVNRIEPRASRFSPNLTGASVDASWEKAVVGSSLIVNTPYKQATAFSNASHGNAIFGSLETSSTAIGTVAATQLIFGMRGTQTAPSGGSSSYIRRLTYFPARLPNTTLQGLTQ
jgi:hypothetical protein